MAHALLRRQDTGLRSAVAAAYPRIVLWGSAQINACVMKLQMACIALHSAECHTGCFIRQGSLTTGANWPRAGARPSLGEQLSYVLQFLGHFRHFGVSWLSLPRGQAVEVLHIPHDVSRRREHGCESGFNFNINSALRLDI